MKLFTSLVAVTLVNLAWSMRTAQPASMDPITAPDGITLEANLLPEADGSCTLLIFFDPRCPFCDRLADAHLSMGDTGLPTWWVTDDALRGAGWDDRIPSSAGVLVSRDLFDVLGVEGVPAAGWVRDGRLVASSSLSGQETPADLARPCTADPD